MKVWYKGARAFAGDVLLGDGVMSDVIKKSTAEPHPCGQCVKLNEAGSTTLVRVGGTVYCHVACQEFQALPVSQRILANAMAIAARLKVAR